MSGLERRVLLVLLEIVDRSAPIETVPKSELRKKIVKRLKE